MSALHKILFLSACIAVFYSAFPTEVRSLSFEDAASCENVTDPETTRRLSEAIRPFFEFDRPEEIGGRYSLERHLEWHQLFYLDCGDSYAVKSDPIQNDRIVVLSVRTLIEVSKDDFKIISFLEE